MLARSMKQLEKTISILSEKLIRFNLSILWSPVNEAIALKF